MTFDSFSDVTRAVYVRLAVSSMYIANIALSMSCGVILYVR